MIALQRVLAALCVALASIVVIANQGCAPKYFQRGDVIALLGLAAVLALVLFWASTADDDGHRVAGSTASAGAAALFASTFSFPLLAAPLAVAGCLRLPRSRSRRRALLLSIPLAVLFTVGLVVLGQAFITADQFRCP